MENLIIRDIQYQDYNDYFNLMIESSKSEFILSDREFRYYLDQMKYNRLSKILVIYSIPPPHEKTPKIQRNQTRR